MVIDAIFTSEIISSIQYDYLEMLLIDCKKELLTIELS